jgi:CheY-like chemotaxis protein
MSKAIHVFIVDDDDDGKEMFCEVVDNLYICSACISASNGQEALQLLQNAQPLPDFIFLDLNMPRMNGKQLLMLLKKDETLAEIPVIIYSTSKLESDRVETRELGSVHFLTKPSSTKQLKKDLEFVFDKKYEEIMSE